MNLHVYLHIKFFRNNFADMKNDQLSTFASCEYKTRNFLW